MSLTREQLQGTLPAGVILRAFTTSNVQRPTELYALFHILRGFYPQGMDVLPQQESEDTMPKRGRIEDGDVIVIRDPDFVGELCPVCNKRKPRTADHWHRDATGADGLRTDRCKACARVDVARRMQAKRREAQAKSQYARAEAL